MSYDSALRKGASSSRSSRKTRAASGSSWRQAQDLARCRLVLSVKSTRRDSVEYVVAHRCEAALTPEPHR